MYRSLLLLCLSMITAVSGHTQNPGLTLTLRADNPAGLTYLGSVYVRASLKNESGKPLRIVDPGHIEPLWGVDRVWWELSLDGNSLPAYRFAERPSRRFARKNNTVLKPGDSVVVAVYPLEFKTEGRYVLTLTYKQLKDSASEAYVDKSLLRDNEDFVVRSEPLAVSIARKSVRSAAPPMPYADLQNHSFTWSIAEALAKPEEAYRMMFRDATPATMEQLQGLRNLQWIEIRDARLDSFPALFNETNLQHLYYESAKSSVYFPPLPQLSTLKYVYLSLAQLDTLPGFLYRQKELQHLELRFCGVKKLSPRIGQLTQLRELVLTNTTIETVPAEFSRLVNLESLTLESPLLKNIDFLANLPHLKTVSIVAAPGVAEQPLVAQLKARGVQVFIR